MTGNTSAMACSRARRCGFTVVELIVACVVTSVIIGGVYSTFHHCVKVKTTTTESMDELATANAILGELVGAIENVVIVYSSGPIAGLFRGHDGGAVTIKATFVERHPGQPNVVQERILYRWHRPKASEGDDRFILTYKGLPFAGTNCIHSLRQGDQPLDELFDSLESVIIAKDIDDLSVKYRAVDDPAGQWQTEWKSPEIPAVWISVRIGDTTRDAVIVPRAKGRLLG